MKKLTKVGFSALCGSLAAVCAANAGEMTISGGATVTHTSNTTSVTGNPIGMNTGLTFDGSGELDGGQAVAYSLALADGAAYSNANITLTTNSLGSFKIDQGGGGGGIGAYDDVTPTAWEESWGAGLGLGLDLAKGVGSSTNVTWTSPSMIGSKLILGWTPRQGGTTTADKAASGDGGAKGSAYDILLDLNTDQAGHMPNIFIGGSRSELSAEDGNGANTQNRNNDHEEVVVGFKYSIGPLALGAQTTGEFTGSQKGGETEYYHNRGWGASFNINDNLSISYGEYNSRRGFVGKSVDAGAGGDWDTTRDMREIESRSIQLAYTMGGASIKIASNEVDDASYTSGTTTDLEGTTVALTLAF